MDAAPPRERQTREARERFEELKARNLREQRLLEAPERRTTSEPQGRKQGEYHSCPKDTCRAARSVSEGSEAERPKGGQLAGADAPAEQKYSDANAGA